MLRHDRPDTAPLPSVEMGLIAAALLRRRAVLEDIAFGIWRKFVMKIAFAKPELPGSGTIVVGVLEEHRLTHTAQLIDKQTKGAIARALAVGRFKGKPEEQLSILAPQGIQAGRILLIGLGKAEALDGLALQAIGGRLVSALNAAGEHAAAVAIDEVSGLKLSLADVAAHVAFGARLRA